MANFIFNAEKHEYTVDGVVIPSNTQILKAEGFLDYSKIPVGVLEASQKFGSAVHRTTEYNDKSILNEDELDDNLRPPLEAWRNFNKDYRTEITLIEAMLYSKIWWFAGMLDRIVAIDGESTLVEIKTPYEISDTTALQTAGYEILVEENLDIKIKNRLVVQLLPDGQYKVTSFKEKMDRNVFLSAVQNYHWKRKHLRR